MSVIKSSQSQGFKKTVSVFVLMALLVSVISGFTACGYNYQAKEIAPTADEDVIVGAVNGHDIHYDELCYAAVEWREMLENKYGEGIWENPETAELYRDELYENVINSIISCYATITLCEEHGYKKPLEKKEIKQLIDQEIYAIIISILESNDVNVTVETSEDGTITNTLNVTDEQLGAAYAQYETTLRSYGMTDRVIRLYLASNFLRDELQYIFCEKEKIIQYSDDDIWEYMMSDKFICTNHVFISCETEEDFESRLAVAQSVRQGLLNGKEIADYIKDGTDDDFSRVSTVGYYFTYGEMYENYEKAAFDLEVGQTSEIITESNGYYIIQRFEKDIEYLNLHMSSYTNQIIYALLDNIIEEHRRTLTVVLNDYGKSLDLTVLTLPEKEIEDADLLDTTTSTDAAEDAGTE